MTDEEIAEAKAADEKYEESKTDYVGPNGAVAEMMAMMLEQQFGSSYEKYIYDESNSMYQFFFRIDGADMGYKAARLTGVTTDILEFEESMDDLSRSLHDTLNIGMSSNIHAGVFLMSDTTEDGVLYFSVDGKKIASGLD